MNDMRYSTQSLREHVRGDIVVQMMAAAIEAVEPGAAVRRVLRCKGTTLLVGDQAYDLEAIERVIGVAFGKAGAPMIMAAAGVLGDRFSQGIAVIKDGHRGDIVATDALAVSYTHLTLPTNREV